MTSRKLEVIGEHTVDVSLLSGGWVLDAGCRDFTFARGMVARGCQVLAVDADPTVIDPGMPGVKFVSCAVASGDGQRSLVMHADPQARYLAEEYVTGSGPVVSVHANTIQTLMEMYGINFWDVVKLDIEGAEYDILRTWLPIARQISVEFHEHVRPRPQALYDEIFGHLADVGYEVVRHVKEARHCCAPSWWDSLFILGESV